MKTKQILKQTACAAIAVVLLCGCNHSPSIDNETSNTDMTQNTSTVLVPETSTETTAATTETLTLPEVVIPESYGEWFLSPITKSNNLKRIDIPVEYEDWILKTPGMVTEVHGSFEYTIEFFKETYRFGEGLQVRVSIKNIGNDTDVYIYHHAGGGISDGTQRRLPAYRTDQYSNKTNIITQIEIKPEEALTFEYLFYVSPGSFPKEGTYTFGFEAVNIPLEVIAG